MLLTLSARRAAGESVRRLPARRLIALAAAIVAGTAAALALRPALSPVTSPAVEQPVWAGSIGERAAGPIVMPPRETSASYTSPVAIQAASRAGKRCADATCAAPQRDLRTLLPPRRPAPEPVVAAVVAPAPIVVAPPPEKPKSVFSASGLIDRLPKARHAAETLHHRRRQNVRPDQALLARSVIS